MILESLGQALVMLFRWGYFSEIIGSFQNHDTFEEQG